MDGTQALWLFVEVDLSLYHSQDSVYTVNGASLQATINIK